MPRVEKQLPNNKPVVKRPSKTGSIWDRAIPVQDVPSKGMHINVYGRYGSGKTSFACTFPKPLLLLGFEDGTDSVKEVDGVTFVLAENTAELKDLADEAVGRGFRTVVLDTATSLQDLILKELLRLDKIPVQLSWGMVTKDQYRQRSEKCKEFMRLFTDLPINVVILGHEKNHTSKDDEGGGDSELLTPFVATSIGKSACEWLNNNVNHICQTYVREGFTEREMRVGQNTTKIKQATGKPEFCLRTQRGHGTYAAKIRADKNIEIPDVIVNPTYDKLLAAINGDPLPED